MIQHPRALDRPHLVRVESGALAAGTEMNWTPPVRQHIEIISIQITLDTDGNAANRRMAVEWGGIADDDVVIPCPDIQIANTIYSYFWLRGLGYANPAIVDNLWAGPLPLGLIFQAPEQIRSDTINGLVGDQITSWRIRYMMWQDPVLIA